MRPRLEADYFDALYAERDDPWHFAMSGYERTKYDRTLAALGERRFPRGLEIGCSIGVLTERLAARCDELLAVDLAERAVAQARERVAGLAHVRVERRRVPEELPAGAWDLLVASEVLYYLDRATLLAAIDPLAAALAPGGTLLAVHWRPETETYPLQGDEVHALLHERLPLRHVLEVVESQFRLDRWDAP